MTETESFLYDDHMTKHKKPKILPASYQLDDEFTTHDQVNQVFRDRPEDYLSKLEEMGFVYQDDDELDKEERDEAAAKPLNSNQKQLVSYFNGEIPLSQKTLEIFLEERRRPKPNYPLFRKYFKSSNAHLLSLILHGLQLTPVSDELLSDLAYFHEFKGILRLLVDHFMIACEKQENLEVFSEIVQEFYYTTTPDGFDAFYELREKFPVGTRKRAVIDFLEEAAVDDEDVKF